MSRGVLLIDIGTQLGLTGVVPSGQLGEPWTAAFEAFGNIGPVEITLVGGSLPPGATLTDNGDGTAEATAAEIEAIGYYPFTLQVRDKLTGLKAVQMFSVRIARSVPLVILGSLASVGTTGVAWDGGTLTGQGVQGTAQWAYLGTVPGITISSAGVVGGVPSQSGPRTLTFRLTDTADGASTTRNFTVDFRTGFWLVETGGYWLAEDGGRIIRE